MSIESSCSVQSLSISQNIDKKNFQIQKNKIITNINNNREIKSNINLSNILDQLRKQDNHDNDVDIAKVKRIKNDISKGLLSMDNDIITDALINHMKLMFDY